MVTADNEPPKSNHKPIVDKDGCKVEILMRRVAIYDPHGKLLRMESIIDYTKTNIRGEYGSLKEKGIDLEKIKIDEGMTDVDDYDFICHVAFDQRPLTRAERAGKVRQSDFFSKYSGPAREVLEALLDKYMNAGINEIESTEILKLDPFVKYGKPAKIASYFGGPKGYYAAVEEMEKMLYEAS